MNSQDTYILAIESSCDDTSAAVLHNDKILANKVAGQDVHREYGGVVPELASRAHQQNIIPVVAAAIKEAGINKTDISAIAFTRGPGLIGSLLVGTSFAKSFAMALDIPLIEVDHMQAHVLAHFIDEPKPSFPFLCLTVSGGHTQISLVKDFLEMEIIGRTTDDAAGEAFDKGAKILGLPYPGGPLIDKYAEEGNDEKYKFPSAKTPGLDFSYSGLKTSLLYFVRDGVKEDPDFIKNNLNDISASYQKAIIDHAFSKLIQAAEKFDIKDIAIAGGVSANSGFRKRLGKEGEKRGWKTYIPQFQYCTDNAAMIGITGYFKYLKKEFAGQDSVPFARS